MKGNSKNTYIYTRPSFLRGKSLCTYYFCVKFLFSIKSIVSRKKIQNLLLFCVLIYLFHQYTAKTFHGLSHVLATSMSHAVFSSGKTGTIPLIEPCALNGALQRAKET